jgi:ankyrin repeat protein
MALKLVTSEAYVNNIRNFLPEKQNSKTPVSEKSKKVFDKIINSPNFIFDKSDKKITDYITTLLSIRPGRTLFKRLLKADKPLTIVLDSEEDSCFSSKKSTVILNDSKVSYHVSVNPDGEKIFIPSHPFITLAHELIHALHYFEDQYVWYTKTTSKDIIDPDLDDLEEQETIIGKKEEGTFCENVFLFHFGYPLRINHRGLALNGEDTVTASGCASLGTLGSLKEMLSSNPSLLNLPQLVKGTLEMTPLNAAIWAHQYETTEYLMNVGVDVNARDKYFGTALHAAAITNSIWITTLLGKGVDPNVKNPKGFTALELALLAKQDRATRVLARKTNLQEIDSQGLSILHRALEQGSPEGIKALIQNGADINCKDLEGNTPLMRLCSFDYPKNKEEEFKQKFKSLLENDHLDINAKNNKGESAISLAAQKRHNWQVDALEEKGAQCGMICYASDDDSY